MRDLKPPSPLSATYVCITHYVHYVKDCLLVVKDSFKAKHLMTPEKQN